MKKLKKNQMLSIVGIILTLLFILWLVSGGQKKAINHDLQQIEKIIEHQ